MSAAMGLEVAKQETTFRPAFYPTAEQIFGALGGKRSGDGYMVPCPVPGHEDKKPSCFISERDGKVLAYCHAHCSQDEVLDALATMNLDIRNKGNGSTINFPKQRRAALAPVPQIAPAAPTEHPELGEYGDRWTYRSNRW